MPTVTPAATASFQLGPFDTLTLSSGGARGAIVLTSQAPKLCADQTLTPQNGTFGPWGAPMSVVMTITQGACDYTVNAQSLTVAQTQAAQALVSGARKQLRKLTFLGDSLTNASFLPNIPRGVGSWAVNSSYTNLNSAGNWIANSCIDGRAAATAGGSLETDGTGRLRWTFTADTAGAWVDVSAGGFFAIESGTANKAIYVAIAKGFQRVSAGSDSVTVTGIVTSNAAQPIYFPSWVQMALGQSVSYAHYGIGGDTLAGVETRWTQAVVDSPDALVLLIATNDAPATAALADALLARYVTLAEQMIARVPMLYIGGIFPRTDVAAGIRQNLARLSEGLRRYAQTRPLQVRFWDAWPRLVSPSASDGSFRTGVAHTDNLHLMPYGAQVATEDLVAQLRQDWSIPTSAVKSRGFTPWDSTSRTGTLNTNPTLKGTGGTVTGASGITGTAPDNWTITRSSSNQTLTTSTAATTDGQDAFVMTVANAGAADYHQISQVATLPAGIVAGDYIVIELDAQLQQATLITTLQAQAVMNGNLNSAYVIQPGRALSVFASGVSQPFIRLQSQPILVTGAMTSATLSLRFGGGAGSSGVLAVNRFELLRVD